MTALLVAKTIGGRLAPIDDAGREAIDKLRVGDIVRVEMKRPRNVDHHRKLFALLELILRNQTRYASMDALLDAIKVFVGHCTVMKLRDGREVYVPKSISFSAMDQTEFDQFFDRVVKVVTEQIIPGLDRKDLERELLDLCA